MKLVIQRVSRATVTSDGVVTGDIGTGLVVLIGVADGDTEKQAEMPNRRSVNGYWERKRGLHLVHPKGMQVE